MIKHIALCGLLGALLSSAAFAQQTPPADPPAAAQPQAAPAAQPAAPAAPAQAQATITTPQNSDECMQVATELAVTAEEKKLAEDKLDRIEDLLTKMETHCDAKQFQEAMAVAKDIKSAIETQ